MNHKASNRDQSQSAHRTSLEILSEPDDEARNAQMDREGVDEIRKRKLQSSVNENMYTSDKDEESARKDQITDRSEEPMTDRPLIQNTH